MRRSAGAAGGACAFTAAGGAAGAAGAGALTGGGAVAFTAAGGTGAVAGTLVEPASLALGEGASGTRIDATGGTAAVQPSLPAAAAGVLAFLRLGGIAKQREHADCKISRVHC